MGKDVEVKTVVIYNRGDCCQSRISNAEVRLLDKDEIIMKRQKLASNENRLEIPVVFDWTPPSTSVVAYDSIVPPRLSAAFRNQIKGQLRNAMEHMDTSIALMYGNKTTIGQVCAFAQGLTSGTVTQIPGFCCLDAPYQSKNNEEWGEKVRFWD